MTEREPIDLQKHRLARELEGELGGLFGIDRADIESAIERLWGDISRGEYNERARLNRIPESLQRVIHCLDVVYESARAALRDEDDESFTHVLELVENYQKRISRLRNDHSD